jgi:hypothetical protein
MAKQEGYRVMRTAALVVLASLFLPYETAAPAQQTPAEPGVRVAPDGSKWTFASFACQFSCRRRVLQEHHEVAGVLGAMIGGDAVLMVLDPWHGLDALALDDLLAVQITFAAQEAPLGAVAQVINHSGNRILFVPKDADNHVSLRLHRVALGDLLKTLAAFGEVKLPGWNAGE